MRRGEGDVRRGERGRGEGGIDRGRGSKRERGERKKEREKEKKRNNSRTGVFNAFRCDLFDATIHLNKL